MYRSKKERWYVCIQIYIYIYIQIYRDVNVERDMRHVYVYVERSVYV